MSPPQAAAEPVSRNGYPRIMSGGEPSSIKRDRHVPRGSRFCSCMRRTILHRFRYIKGRFKVHKQPLCTHKTGCMILIRKEAAECIRHCTASGGPGPFRKWWDRPTSPIPCSGRWPRAGWATPISSPALGAPARPPAPGSWPRPSTVSIPSTARPAASVTPAGASTAARCWM